ncbi:MATE family efflux transporter [Parablautia muri]|uniref:Probable multidrug resistance protein NorM n=1 Tax=Parablautia muri TaxID=2320879 RepID=A0A9X5GRE1_9FIRM|nr:MATE family efflux transporter [Parablautia muri]NBJ93143.1 MATE family efflux transporter [Parablautia muri]
MADTIMQKENRMGTEKMSKLIIATGIPLMLSLLINSLYNFIDSVFVSRVSEDALTALSLSAPVQVLVSSLGLGNAVGLNAVISRALGEKKPDKVRKAADASIFIALCSWVIIVLICLIFVKPYFAWQSGGNEIIAAYGRDYLMICMLFSIGQMGQWVFDRFVIASGKSHLFLFTLSAASITNLILDPIFIFGLFGIPRMEAKGAAVATIIGQIVGAIAGILINKRWNKEIEFSFHLHQDKESILEILKVGIPSTLVQVLTSFVSIVMNSILLAFSTTAVAVYGVCARIQNIATVGVHGIDNGLIPIVAYNYGAGKKKRIEESIRWTLIYSVLLYLVFFVGLELIPKIVLGIFDASDYMLTIGIPALRILAVAYFASIPNLVFAAALQGLSLGTKSMYLTMARQAILPVLFALGLRGFGNLNLIWIAFILAELVGMPLAVFLWRGAYKRYCS